MNKQEFQEYYKKNKTVVIGVPIILFVLMLDFFVLKPARMKKVEERNAGSSAVTAQPAAQASSASAAGTEAKPPIKIPDPIKPPAYPALSGKVESRFQLTKIYPFQTGQRNIFCREDKKIEIIPVAYEEETEETYERPDITYHGFFSLGPDKIAILKTSGQLLLTKVGMMLKSSPFKLGSVFPDHVVIVDTSETSKEFEVALSEKSSEGGMQK